MFEPDYSDLPSLHTPGQRELALGSPGPLAADAPMAVLDLFSGIGGFSAGFKRAGFSQVGVDSEVVAVRTYEDAGFGKGIAADLRAEIVNQPATVLIGGPPCTPWSSVNLRKRGTTHEDYGLVERFVRHVEELEPRVFVMENVPPLKGDPAYSGYLERLKGAGYDVGAKILRYDHFGAATRRRRLFTVGIRSRPEGAHEFFSALLDHRRPSTTVRDAIGKYRLLADGAVADHDWSQLSTIANYSRRYETGQYGWRKLAYDEPAPSFGSVAKTYILHPEAGERGFPLRVLSVREVMAIMGFPENTAFPAGTARARRYQMAANAVSPHASYAIALTVRRMLYGPSAEANDARVSF